MEPKTNELLFLGTGAHEGVPAAYCRCDHCLEVRSRGGREIRSRSALRLGTSHQIDISPDNYWQMLRNGIDMYDVEHVLITHSDDDHFRFEGLLEKTMSAQTNGKPLYIYLSRPAKKLVEDRLRSLYPDGWQREFREGFILVGLDYFESFRAGDLTVEAVVGNHSSLGEEERAINYLIHFSDAKSLLYALDTGYYEEASWEFLKGKYIEILVMECTFGGRGDRGEYPAGHLDIASFLKMLERMSAIGFIDSSTRIFTSHINPHHGLVHGEMQEHFDSSLFVVTVAWDGLRLNL